MQLENQRTCQRGCEAVPYGRFNGAQRSNHSSMHECSHLSRAEAPESSHNLKNKKTIFCKQTLIKYHVFHPWKTFSNEQAPQVGEALASIEPSLI
jgi:hypothetical protein